MISRYVSLVLWCLVLVNLIACAVRPKFGFDTAAVPPAPDYSLPQGWAALPDKKDLADSLPSPDFKDVQAGAAVDIFFIHPTTYIHKKGFDHWNASVDDPSLNERTDKSTILYQASLFNGVGKVYAPRYRQAHIQAYFTRDTEAALKAFEVAYEDVSRAFQFYLEHYNQGRPVILAAHSQGSTHGIRLVKEFFDGKPLQDQLIVAYLVGMPVLRDTFQQIPPCRTPEETGCFCSWRTFKMSYEPRKMPVGPEIAVTNPLSWTIDSSLVPRSQNMGAILRNFSRVLPNLADAQINNGILWTDKPKFPGSFLLTRRNYHVADYNLYYVNVQENAKLRTKVFLQK